MTRLLARAHHRNTVASLLNPRGRALPLGFEETEAARPRGGEAPEEDVARHGAGAQAGHVRRQDLDVEPVETTRAEPLDEVQERQLGGVRLAVEHALRREGAVHLDAVDPSDELRA